MIYPSVQGAVRVCAPILAISCRAGLRLSPRLAEREVDALCAQLRVGRLFHGRYAMVAQPVDATPYGGSAMVEGNAGGGGAARHGSEKKCRLHAQRHRDDSRTDVTRVCGCSLGSPW